MKRFDPSNKHEDGMAPRTDGEWIRYSDHVEAMKRIAGDGWQAEPVALTEDQIAVRAGIPFVGLSVKLVKALRRLSFAAQTSGGTAGRDDELMSAIQQAQEALEAAKGKGLEEVAAPAPSASPSDLFAGNAAFNLGYAKGHEDARTASPVALTDAVRRLMLATDAVELGRSIHNERKPEDKIEGPVWNELKHASSEVRALLAASPADQVGWQPIETAPKDREVWAFNGEQGRMQWSEGSADNGEGWALWVWCDPLLSDADPEPEQPTHFMPLPADPVAAPSASAQAEPVAWMRVNSNGVSTGVTDIDFYRDLWMAEGSTVLPLYAGHALGVVGGSQ